MRFSDIIQKKRDGGALSDSQINAFVKGLSDDSLPAEQAAALAMAIYFRSMTPNEAATLTNAMASSGEMLNWDADVLGGPVIDKHSTGGVGDKVSLILAPLAAACGLYVPMISGRGLGFSGGTLDKLESIRGYNITPSIEHFQRVVRENGCAIVGQTEALAPADRRLYAIRDITATVESIPLITASILSKKLAAGVHGLVMDIKVGNGSFNATDDDARKLATSLIDTAQAAGLPTCAVLSDMNQVLGGSIGNALEVREACDFLAGNHQDARLYELVIRLCTQMIQLADPDCAGAAASAKAATAINDGSALERFGAMVTGLGGPADFAEKYGQYLPRAQCTVPLLAEQSGQLLATETRAIGLALIELGGGRKRADDTLDLSCGFSDFLPLGTEVEADTVICHIHSATADLAERAAEHLRSALTFGASGWEQAAVIRETL